MSDAYLLWKTAHVVSAAILFGTGLGIAFFAWFGYRRAMRLKDIGSLRTVLRLMVIGDLVFTTPAVIFQVISGLVLIHLNGWSYTSLWSETVLGLYIAVGLFWLPVVALQITLSQNAEQVAQVDHLAAGFHRRFTAWFVLGIPAFLLVIALFYLMISKALPIT